MALDSRRSPYPSITGRHSPGMHLSRIRRLEAPSPDSAHRNTPSRLMKGGSHRDTPTSTPSLDENQRLLKSQVKLNTESKGFQLPPKSEMFDKPLKEVSFQSCRLNTGSTSRSQVCRYQEDSSFTLPHKPSVPIAHIKLHLPVSTPKTPATPSKAQTLTSLRARVIQKFQPVPLEPPTDQLSMSVIQRSEYFINKRERRRKEKFQEKYQKEIQECTFHPVLCRRRSLSRLRKTGDMSLSLEGSRPTSRCSSYRVLYERRR